MFSHFFDFGLDRTQLDFYSAKVMNKFGAVYICDLFRELTTLDLVGEEMEYFSQELSDPQLQELRWLTRMI